ncbi:MAG: hypothetical protein GY830_02040 [Bacteroidetes bacterium]|nr:hypothetical protein [Bacteroidota bacterium]
MSNNIKCGNSLINDREVAGDKAFDWDVEFKEIMGNGGFDVVIGNPPYFNIQTLGANSKITQFIQNSYHEIWQDKSDIIFYFIAKAIHLTKNKVGFIVSNAFMFSDKAQKLRNYILNKTQITKIINFEKYLVFSDALITTSILELDKTKENIKTLAYSFKDKEYSQNFIAKNINLKENYIKVNLKKDNVFALVDEKINNINMKIDSDYPKLNTVIKIGKGMETAANKIFIFKNKPKQFPKEFIKKRMSGDIIKKYSIDQFKEYILYFEDIENFEDLPLSIQTYLLENRDFLENRADKKRRKTSKWWNYTFPMHKEFYHLNKIWTSYRSKNNTFCFDNTKEYIGLTNTTVIFDTNKNLNLKYVLILLNSNTLNFRYKTIGKQTGNGVYEYFENGLGKLPIPQISKEAQQPFIQKSDTMLDLNKQLQDKKTKLLTRLYDNLSINKITKKLESFYDYDFKTFISELKKQKIDLSLKQQDEWSEYFNEYKTEINELQSKIQATDKEIDMMVYSLYDLTDEEIKVIEES